APSACTIFTRLPAGVSGPATRQTVSSIRTVPWPSMIGFSSVNTRPISASARLLRNGWLLLAELFERARRRHSGTAATANTANIRSWISHDGWITNDSRPTSSAASPSQNRNTPGTAISSAIRMMPNTSQFQVPNVENISAMIAPLKTRPLPLLPRRRDRRRGRPCARHRAAARGGLRGRGALAEGRFRDLADAGQRTQNAGRLDRQHDDLLVRRIGQLTERPDVFVGDEIVQRGDVTLGDRLGNHLR